MYNLNNFSLLEIVIICLFVFRLSLMLTSEDGFLSFAFAIRLLGNKIHSGKESINKFDAWKISLFRSGDVFTLIPSNHFGQLISCIWCTSVWIGIIAIPLYLLIKDTYFILFFYGLALSTISIIFHRFV